MFENIIETSIFVRILIFAIVSILCINIVAALMNATVSIIMRVRGIR